ncbi:hypothetical protein E2562_019684 [Oryza meyeriana var. granulata]|nr:hypothetical protein E2562_019684 [Oryza meyeriana var. granulata]
MARLALVGITQLNLFSAICVLFLAQAPVSMWLKVLVVPLPVVFLPLGFGAIMLSKLADSDDRALNLGAAFVLTEFVYVFALGGIFLAVMTEAPVAAVATVTALLIAATVLVWRSTFNYPKCLKSDFGRFICAAPVSCGKLSTSGIAEGNNVMAEELIIKHPKLAEIIKYSFDVFVVIELAVYIVLMLFLFKVSEQYWQPLLSTAVVSPLFLLPLYSAPILRDAYVKKYTKRPVGSKVILSTS